MNLHLPEVDDPITDSGPTSCQVHTVEWWEDTEGNVLEWELGVLWDAEERNLLLLLHLVNNVNERYYL